MSEGIIEKKGVPLQAHACICPFHNDEKLNIVLHISAEAVSTADAPEPHRNQAGTLANTQRWDECNTCWRLSQR